MKDIDFSQKTTQPLWLKKGTPFDFPPLEGDIETDVAIVGGGMVGITTAWMLKKQGLKVALVEADRIFWGTTGYTTAKVTSQHNLIYDKLTKKFGTDIAKQYAQVNELAKETIASIVEDNKIDCDFSRQAAYVYTHQDKYVEKIKGEFEAALSLGINASLVENLPISLPIKLALRFDNQAQFHPIKYLNHLVREITNEDQCIYENTRAIDIEDKLVITEKGNIKAKNIVIASHYPFFDGLGLYFSRLHAERSYVLAVKIKEDFPEGMYINAESPTRSLRFQEVGKEKIILVGGENHKTGQSLDTSKHFDNLLAFANEQFTVEKVVCHWSTQDLVTIDDLPYVGKLTANHPDVYVATGFAKWGMTNSTAAAMTITDLITKGESPWEDLYSPSRFKPTASAGTFIKENLNVAANLLSGKLSTLSNHTELEKGNAKIFEGGGQKYGAYKDQHGTLHIVDTTCTHLGCELNWNCGEKSWDCPCHGSRFSYKGEVIEGPALKNLPYKENN